MDKTPPPAAEVTPQDNWTVEDETEAAIKPCPRCGSKAEVEDWLKGTILCVACGHWTGDDMDGLDEAIEWWNNQPLVDSLRARIAELERTLEWVCEPRLQMDEMHRRHREAGNELKQRRATTPQPVTSVPVDVRELLAMVDELCVLAHKSERSWLESDDALLTRIERRRDEMVAHLGDDGGKDEA